MVTDAAEFFVWLVREPDGRDGPVSTVLPGIGAAPLVSMRRDLALAMRPVAESHAHASGRPVRLVRFSAPEELERL
ncbi:MAG: hypothetical protein KA105_02920 [Caulobacter sp.]|nr:hypothetical protein [Caulobacter sp.]